MSLATAPRLGDMVERDRAAAIADAEHLLACCGARGRIRGDLAGAYRRLELDGSPHRHGRPVVRLVVLVAIAQVALYEDESGGGAHTSLPPRRGALEHGERSLRTEV